MKYSLSDTTLIITNYRRTANLQLILNRFSDFLPIWVVNNNSNITIPKTICNRVFNNNKNKGNVDRWAKAIHCDTEYICVIDDDVLPYKKTLLDLHIVAKKTDNNLIGIQGWTEIENENSFKKCDSEPCNNAIIVSGKCIFLKTKSLRKIFLKHIHGVNLRCGDDILISLAMTKYFKELHTIINSEIEELPDYGIDGVSAKDRYNAYVRCKRI